MMFRHIWKSAQVFGRSCSVLNSVKNVRSARLNNCNHRLLTSKTSASSSGNGSTSGFSQTGLQRFLSRLLAPNPETGENAILRVLGYYTAESRAICTGKTLYDQIVLRSNSAIKSELGGTMDFMPRFELLTVHVYLTFRRLRLEKGSPIEKDCELAMQILFEAFWKDVRHRMMMEEGGLTLIQSGKWLRECEKIFFGTAVALDAAWGDSSKMNTAISKSVSCLNDDQARINKFRAYMLREVARLETTTSSQIWEGCAWDATYLVKHSQ